MTCTVGLRALLVTCTSLAEESFKSGAWMRFGSVEQTAGVGWKGDGQTRDMPTLLDNSQYIAMALFFFARHIFLLFYWYFINAECNCSKVLNQHNFNIITSLCIWKLNLCTFRQVENLLCFWPPSSRDCSRLILPTTCVRTIALLPMPVLYLNLNKHTCYAIYIVHNNNST